MDNDYGILSLQKMSTDHSKNQVNYLTATEHRVLLFRSVVICIPRILLVTVRE